MIRHKVISLAASQSVNLLSTFHSAICIAMVIKYQRIYVAVADKEFKIRSGGAHRPIRFRIQAENERF